MCNAFSRLLCFICRILLLGSLFSSTLLKALCIALFVFCLPVFWILKFWIPGWHVMRWLFLGSLCPFFSSRRKRRRSVEQRTDEVMMKLNDDRIVKVNVVGHETNAWWCSSLANKGESLSVCTACSNHSLNRMNLIPFRWQRKSGRHSLSLFHHTSKCLISCTTVLDSPHHVDAIYQCLRSITDRLCKNIEQLP